MIARRKHFSRLFKRRGSRRFSLPGADAGQALVELALTVPLLVTILIGAAEFALVTHAAIEVANAAKAGAQYAAYSRANAVNQTQVRSAAASEASDITLGTPVITYACSCSNGTACSSGNCATGNVEQTVTVTTQTTFDPLIHVPGLPQTYTLHGSASQKVVNQ
jgi:Flp pilus assembly protein TadG